MAQEAGSTSGHASGQSQDDVDDTQGHGLVGPPEWPYAQVKDWIALALDMPHIDVRVYAVFRSLATRWRNDRRLSRDEIRWLVPGVNGKPLGRTALYESLKRLDARGLVVEQGSTTRRQVRNGAGRFETVEELLWRVNELPIEGEDYAGPRSVFDALDAYPGPGWTAEQRQELHRGTPTTSRVRKSERDNTRSDQGKRGVSAGHTGRDPIRKSGSAIRKSGSAIRKSEHGNAVTSENTGTHTGVPYEVPNSSPLPPSDGSTEPRQDREEETGSPTTNQPRPHDRSTTPSAVARELVDAVQWPLGKPRPGTVDRIRLAAAIDRCLAAGHALDAVRSDLVASLVGAHRPVGSALTRLTELAKLPAEPLTPSAPSSSTTTAAAGDRCPNNPMLRRGRCGCCEPVDQDDTPGPNLRVVANHTSAGNRPQIDAAGQTPAAG